MCVVYEFIAQLKYRPIFDSLLIQTSSPVFENLPIIEFKSDIRKSIWKIFFTFIIRREYSDDTLNVI
jgi:hypothetical protein